MFGCTSIVGLSIIPVPREVFESVEDEKQFQNAFTALTASCEPDGDVIFAKSFLSAKNSSESNYETVFEHYYNAVSIGEMLPYETIK